MTDNEAAGCPTVPTLGWRRRVLVGPQSCHFSPNGWMRSTRTAIPMTMSTISVTAYTRLRFTVSLMRDTF